MAMGPHFKGRVTNDVSDYERHPLIFSDVKTQKLRLERKFQMTRPLERIAYPDAVRLESRSNMQTFNMRLHGH